MTSENLKVLFLLGLSLVLGACDELESDPWPPASSGGVIYYEWEEEEEAPSLSQSRPSETPNEEVVTEVPVDLYGDYYGPCEETEWGYHMEKLEIRKNRVSLLQYAYGNPACVGSFDENAYILTEGTGSLGYFSEKIDGSLRTRAFEVSSSVSQQGKPASVGLSYELVENLVSGKVQVRTLSSINRLEGKITRQESLSIDSTLYFDVELSRDSPVELKNREAIPAGSPLNKLFQATCFNLDSGKKVVLPIISHIHYLAYEPVYFVAIPDQEGMDFDAYLVPEREFFSTKSVDEYRIKNVEWAYEEGVLYLGLERQEGADILLRIQADPEEPSKATVVSESTGRKAILSNLLVYIFSEDHPLYELSGCE